MNFKIGLTYGLPLSVSLTHTAENNGIVFALNRLISDSLQWNPTYIARMDADDVCMSDRISRQVAFLETNPNIAVLGGAIKMFKSGTTLVKYIEYPSHSILVHFGMFYNCVMIHPCVMIRADFIRNYLTSAKPSISSTLDCSLYKESFKHAEDYELWLRLISGGYVQISNLPNPPILKLRKHTQNESKSHSANQRKASREALLHNVNGILKEFQNEFGWKLGTDIPADVADAILSGSKFTNVEQVQTAYFMTEMIEKMLLRHTLWSNEEKQMLQTEITNKLGELASLEMKLNPLINPSDLTCWTKWLARSPSTQLGALLTEAKVLQVVSNQIQSSQPQSGQSIHDINRVCVIAFSKDRAFQLREYLRTLDKYLIQPSLASNVAFDVFIIWKASTNKFETSYKQLTNQFPHFKWIQESSFSKDLMFCFERSKASFVLWGVDDVLFYNPLNISPFMEMMSTSNSGIVCSHFRLSPNVVYCHPSNAHSVLPQFHSAHISTYSPSNPNFDPFTQEILKYDRTEATEDWNYPFELCSTLMRTEDALETIKLIVEHYGVDGCSHPNKLEVSGSRIFANGIHTKSSWKNCLCLRNPVLSVITVNRVQDVCTNRIYDEISLEQLEEYFDNNRELDLEYYRTKIFDAVHIGDFVLLHPSYIK